MEPEAELYDRFQEDCHAREKNRFKEVFHLFAFQVLNPEKTGTPLGIVKGHDNALPFPLVKYNINRNIETTKEMFNSILIQKEEPVL